MKTIDENSLHRYVDGFLDPRQRLEVEAWLAERPAERRRVHAWGEQNRLMHQTFDPVLNEAVPQRLLVAATPAGRTGGIAPLVKAAAAAGVLAIAVIGSYFIGRYHAVETTVVTDAALPRAAAVAHAVYTPEVRHPVEVAAADAGHLVGWLSKRLGRQLKAPDFSAEGYSLLGGRLLPGESGPVAQFMYENLQGQRVTLYVRREGPVARGMDDTAFRYAIQDGVGVFYWVDRDSGFALSGELRREALLKLAHSAYSQVSE